MEKTTGKRIIIMCLPLIFTVSLAITLAACMAQAGKTPKDSVVVGVADLSYSEGSVNTQKDTFSKGLSYTSLGDGTCELTGIGQCNDKKLMIPEKNEAGEKVISISTRAFMGNTDIEEITVPSTVISIGDYAFYRSSITSCNIPSSVKVIGDCVFTNCLYLERICVDTKNTAYTSVDGVLYSKDKGELIVYPSGKTGESFTIGLNVTKIAPAAILNCVNLKSITYNGSKKEWQQVTVGANNTLLTTENISFLSAATK